MKLLFGLSFCYVMLLASAAFCQETDQKIQQSSMTQDLKDGFEPLFNGKDLKGWKSARSTGDNDWGPFSVDEEERAIHVYAGLEPGSKQKTDCLISEKEYSHYILKLEYKWLDNRFAPRTDWDRDAGLCFHVHGDLTKVWPYCLEMQIGESPGDKPDSKGKKGRFHAGDLFVLRRGLRTTTAVGKNSMSPPMKIEMYEPGGEEKVGGGIRTPLGVEKPKGEWNEIELHVRGSEEAIFMLNGQVVLETSKFHLKDKKGNTSALEKGHIGLQAEWAELMYRNIRIKELTSEEMESKTMEQQTHSGSSSKAAEPSGSGSPQKESTSSGSK